MQEQGKRTVGRCVSSRAMAWERGRGGNGAGTAGTLCLLSGSGFGEEEAWLWCGRAERVQGPVPWLTFSRRSIASHRHHFPACDRGARKADLANLRSLGARGRHGLGREGRKEKEGKEVNVSPNCRAPLT